MTDEPIGTPYCPLCGSGDGLTRERRCPSMWRRILMSLAELLARKANRYGHWGMSYNVELIDKAASR